MNCKSLNNVDHLVLRLIIDPSLKIGTGVGKMNAGKSRLKRDSNCELCKCAAHWSFNWDLVIQLGTADVEPKRMHLPTYLYRYGLYKR